MKTFTIIVYNDPSHGWGKVKRQVLSNLGLADKVSSHSYQYKDNVNKDNPLAYRMNNLDVSMTNICTEITLHTDEEHSFICCLSSLNLAKYDEWKDTDLVETSIYFLDGVMEEFIQKTNGKESMIRSHRHAKKGRALGLGVMGWHTFLQQKNLPFNSSPFITAT